MTRHRITVDDYLEARAAVEDAGDAPTDRAVAALLVARGRRVGVGAVSARRREAGLDTAAAGAVAARRERLLKMVLGAGLLTGAAVAAELGVAYNTVASDLDALVREGIPICTRAGIGCWVASGPLPRAFAHLPRRASERRPWTTADYLIARGAVESRGDRATDAAVAAELGISACHAGELRVKAGAEPAGFGTPSAAAVFEAAARREAEGLPTGDAAIARELEVSVGVVRRHRRVAKHGLSARGITLAEYLEARVALEDAGEVTSDERVALRLGGGAPESVRRRRLEAIERWRPRRRRDCLEEARPCPWVSCRFHLAHETGRRPWETEQSCALDVADAGGSPLSEVARALGVSRQRVSQIERSALQKLQASGFHLREIL